MRIAQISDTHLLADRAGDPVAALRAACLAHCVADINQMSPDAVIFTGDTTQHATVAEYQLLKQLLDPLNAPCFVVPGNRDDQKTLRTVFADADYLPTGEFFHYVAEISDCRLIAIDSTRSGERKGVFCAERQNWLREVLRSRDGMPTILFTHHPPFDVGDHYIGGYRDSADAQAFEQIVENSPDISALICGHVHWPIQCQWAGTEARISPSVAIDLRKGVDEVALNGVPIWSLYEFTEDGRFVTARQQAPKVSTPGVVA